MDSKLLINIRELCGEIDNLTQQLEHSDRKTEIQKEIIEKKIKILKFSKKPPKISKENTTAAGASSNQQRTNQSLIYWQNSLRNPYCF